MEIIHEVNLDAVGLGAIITKRCLILVEKILDGASKESLKIVDEGNSESGREESLKSLVRQWATSMKMISVVCNVKLGAT